MASRATLLCLLLALGLVARTGALYIKVTEGEKRCFIEEVPKDTLIHGTFSALDSVPGQATSPAVGIVVTATDPAGDLVLNKGQGLTGRFAFTAAVGGEHVLCFTTNTTKWFGSSRSYKLSFALSTGADAVDYEALAKSEHLSELEMFVREVHDRVLDIRHEQSYQKQREAAFRDASEATNGRVAWFSLAQVATLLLTGVYTIYHLKAFFRSKRLVR